MSMMNIKDEKLVRVEEITADLMKLGQDIQNSKRKLLNFMK